MNDQLNNQFWYEVVIDDVPRCLPGTSIHDLLLHIMKATELKYVVTDDVEGGMVLYFQQIEHVPIELNEVLPKFKTVIQFDWADFFLYKNYPSGWESFKERSTRNLDYYELIQETDVTVRAVDDQYMYVYTKDENVVKVISDNYFTESIKFAPIENYIFPY
ncbi:hypothetical protein [Flavobacterium sp.]|uniref:hypothetical protein n=1 Tax=Flavobacterium sp. TaxID=239 RepID=UPI0025C1DC3F|nr:hypothetical protein [Flavobacterium sp.]MBA4155757.1 hypothetical protein [Flavobacterium sp.]